MFIALIELLFVVFSMLFEKLRFCIKFFGIEIVFWN